MSKDKSEPAFPAPAASMEHYGTADGYTGMSLRDYFAAKALPISADQFKRLADVRYPEDGFFLHPDGFEATARVAYAIADAMLAARSA